jgi:hypothetical protein
MTTHQSDANVIVLIENAYECGRTSASRYSVQAPAVGSDLEAWFETEIHDFTGDGHPCGASENAIYDTRIVDAPNRPDLLGQTYGWG